VRDIVGRRDRIEVEPTTVACQREENSTTHSARPESRKEITMMLLQEGKENIILSAYLLIS
jgi:hypothetical protein